MTAILIDLRPTFKQRRERAEDDRLRAEMEAIVGHIRAVEDRTARRRARIEATLATMDGGVQMPCDVEG
jgi:hypothetical protein